MKATRTLNPLHFEDLDPHRFEDLVRQLVYDFREWHSLEALGRAGSDEGMDIRGYEHLGGSLVDSEGEAEPEAFRALELREWRIQCKREQRLGPKRVEEAVAELLKSTDDPPYGVVIAAACDFSKRAREAFRSECLAQGVEEFHLWGKGELEDLLFRPSNDHLLWAYFGVSLRVRRRSITTVLNKRMTTKRRLAKHIGDIGRMANETVLIRDAEAEEYPRPTDPETFLDHPRWRYFTAIGLVSPDVVLFVTRKHYAWWDVENGTWDYVPEIDTSWPRFPELTEVAVPPEHPDTETVRRYWEVKVPKEFKARCVEVSVLHYDQILLVDDLGDGLHPPPHLVVDFEGRDTPFRRSRELLVKGHGLEGEQGFVEEFERGGFFPQEIPEISAEEWNAHWNRGQGGA